MQIARACTAGPSVVAVVWAIALMTMTSSATARTIELDAAAIDRLAGIAAAFPEAGMALSWDPGQRMLTNTQLTVPRDGHVMFRFPLDQIPADQRIVRAELVLTAHQMRGASGSRLHIWRLVGGWGEGVNWTHRRQHPEPVQWSAPGAAAPGQDRAMRPTDVVQPGLVTEGDAVILNVTDDVVMWHQGVAENQGWLLSVEDDRTWFSFQFPPRHPNQVMRLRITYEPQ